MSKLSDVMGKYRDIVSALRTVEGELCSLVVDSKEIMEGLRCGALKLGFTSPAGFRQFVNQTSLEPTIREI